MPGLEGDEEDPSRRTDCGQYKCICCGTRYWKQNKLVRRAAQCKGVRYFSGYERRRCKAWRCRFNNQCSKANEACPLCGAFKPPEFQSLQPASAPNLPSHVQPVPNSYVAFDPAKASSSSSSSTLPVTHQPLQPGPVMRQEPVRAFQENIPSGNVTLLPLLEGMTQRFLTDV